MYSYDGNLTGSMLGILYTFWLTGDFARYCNSALYTFWGMGFLIYIYVTRNIFFFLATANSIAGGQLDSYRSSRFSS